MFDIGWTELLVIGIVALIVVGPKDLPVMFRALGQFTAKARGMAREFQRAMENAADEAGVKDVSADLRKMTSARNLGLDKLQDAAKGWDKWDEKKRKSSETRAKGPETAKLSEERAETARKVRETAAQKAGERSSDEAVPQPAQEPQGTREADGAAEDQLPAPEKERREA